MKSIVKEIVGTIAAICLIAGVLSLLSQSDHQSAILALAAGAVLIVYLVTVWSLVAIMEIHDKVWQVLHARKTAAPHPK
ncbi:MAG: hypothetical protein ABIK13_04485 [Patescibacteria group bacterium]